MYFNTVLFRRPARSWSTRQLISIYTEVSLRSHQQYNRVTRNRTTEDTNLKFQKSRAREEPKLST